jgi:hypothetical protein
MFTVAERAGSITCPNFLQHIFLCIVCVLTFQEKLLLNMSILDLAHLDILSMVRK